VTRIDPQSVNALRAGALVRALQVRFAERLWAVSRHFGCNEAFERVDWLRDGGRHGGGDRLACGGTAIFDRASINVSSVHYDDEPDRRLSSATALSTIIHPRNPRAASIHMHYSWTEMREGGGYWRMMADLNPAIPDAKDERRFVAALQDAAAEVYAEARAQGDRYFYIPALDRHRGVAHFYLEGYSSGDFEVDAALAQRIGEAMIDCYAELLKNAIASHPESSEAERREQLAYHTLYLFQVLTLDRGTTSGLLVHDQNDVGILGSLPGHVDRDLLASWASRVEVPQDALVRALVDALPKAHPCPVDDATRQALAVVVREHYRAHPEALELQASGNSIPPTVSNHGRS